jgi:hypothetical protein
LNLHPGFDEVSCLPDANCPSRSGASARGHQAAEQQQMLGPYDLITGAMCYCAEMVIGRWGKVTPSPRMYSQRRRSAVSP